MADEEQLSILRRGVEVWNEWREENTGVEIVLGRVQLVEVDLHGINLIDADLSGASITGSDVRDSKFQGAKLDNANLYGIDLSGADLSLARLVGTNLRAARLERANLSEADLERANLSRAYLKEACLYDASLLSANLNGVILDKTDFSSAHLRSTILGNVDLSEAIGLSKVIHWGPSTIGMDTLALSKGKVPEDFLRGCGLSDADIEYAKLYGPDLKNDERSSILYRIYDLQASRAVQVSPLFISYSHADREFVDKIGDCLTEKGIRYWRDIHDMKAGRMEKQVDRAIRQNPAVLLVLSKNSLSSDWVEHEVREGRRLEKKMDRDVLCPVALDDSWKDSPWPKRVMEQVMEYNILDFSEWKDDRQFDAMFRRLIDGLELFYKG